MALEEKIMLANVSISRAVQERAVFFPAGRAMVLRLLLQNQGACWTSTFLSTLCVVHPKLTLNWVDPASSAFLSSLIDLT